MNILGLQLLVLFEEVLETSGGGASLEEVGYWGGGVSLKGYIWASILPLSLHPGSQKAKSPLCSYSHSCNVLSKHLGPSSCGQSLSNHKQNLLPCVISARRFVPATIKATNTEDGGSSAARTFPRFVLPGPQQPAT